MILIINNGSETIKLYKFILKEYILEFKTLEELPNLNLNEYKLILLTDGSKINVKDNLILLDLVRNTDLPIIGICYGFQLIAYAYGCKINKLNKKSYGLNLITFIQNNIFYPSQKKYFYAFEKHNYGIEKINNNIIGIANSKDGYEIIKIKNKKIFAFQYHPEIIVTNKNEYSIELFQSFIKKIIEKDTNDDFK